jgi:hypothetical protein
MTIGAPFRIVAAVLVWAVHFAMLYGGVALACARGREEIVPTIIVAATLVATVPAAALVVLSYPHREHFLHWLATTTAALVVLALVWEALAALLAPACR